MPDPFGILIGLASLAVAVLLLRYGDQFSDGNIERDEALAMQAGDLLKQMQPRRVG